VAVLRQFRCTQRTGAKRSRKEGRPPYSGVTPKVFEFASYSPLKSLPKLTNGGPKNGTNHRTFEQWLIALEAEIAELKTEIHHHFEMRRQIAHIESRNLDRALGYNLGDTRPRQERQKKPRRD